VPPTPRYPHLLSPSSVLYASAQEPPCVDMERKESTQGCVLSKPPLTLRVRMQELLEPLQWSCSAVFTDVKLYRGALGESLRPFTNRVPQLPVHVLDYWYALVGPLGVWRPGAIAPLTFVQGWMKVSSSQRRNDSSSSWTRGGEASGRHGYSLPRAHEGGAPRRQFIEAVWRWRTYQRDDHSTGRRSGGTISLYKVLVASS
jgi:hypothetical protein